MKKVRLDRRTVLRGMGAAGIASLALPPLEAMFGPKGTPYIGSGKNAVAAQSMPKRLFIFHFPTGISTDAWFPTGTETNWTLSTNLQPLSPYKQDINVLVGLTPENGGAPGAGDHHDYMSVLVGKPSALRTPGDNWPKSPGGISFDQQVAKTLGVGRKYASLVTATYADPLMTHSGPNAMVPAERSPKNLFNRLFQDSGLPPDQAAAQSARMQSMLDYVKDDIDSLKRLGLSSDDNKRFDEHLESVRALEQAYAYVPSNACGVPTMPNDPTQNDYSTYPAYSKALIDLLVMAMRCDMTRVCFHSMGFTNGDNRYPFINIPVGRHLLSHSGAAADEAELAMYAQQAGKTVDQYRAECFVKTATWNVEQFALLLSQMKGTPEGNGTLLDNSAVVLFSEFSNGGYHQNNNVPIVIAGKAGGSMQTGRLIRYRCENSQDFTEYGGCGTAAGTANIPLCNLWLTMMNAVGVPTSQFGNSTGQLSGLWT